MRGRGREKERRREREWERKRKGEREGENLPSLGKTGRARAHQSHEPDASSRSLL